jgi:glycosyltransferase involved in cell wall biosynthesis
VKPRVLFVSRRVETPLPKSERRRWDALRTELDFRVVAAGEPDGHELALAPEPAVLAGPAFYVALPARVARQLRSFRPHAVVVQGAHETAAVLAARRLTSSDAAVIADVHGDFRAPTRLYGSRLRSLLSPLADRVAVAALRRADGVRTVTAYTTELMRGLGIEPTDEFPAYMDFGTFLQTPPVALPQRPQALFVGVLERYKNVDGLVAAWRDVAARLPEARLRVVGTGALEAVVERAVAELPDRVSWTPRLPQAEVAAALDESTCLVLPSRSEGMGRVVIEAFCRGRAVIGSRVGGIPDLVEDGVNGLLVEQGDGAGLVAALASLLSDRVLAERLGRGAEASAAAWTISADDFARRVRALVERVTPIS